MEKSKKIKEIYEILLQYERLLNKEANITEESYRNYIDRLAVWYLGVENEEIGYYLKGLYNLGIKAQHSTVRRIVFHIIEILNKGVS